MSLKKINDSLWPSRRQPAICRLAVFSAFTAGVDTAARYGGDEFALRSPRNPRKRSAPESKSLREFSPTDDEQPAISASIGISSTAAMARRIEKLLSEADQISTQKARRGRRAALLASNPASCLAT